MEWKKVPGRKKFWSGNKTPYRAFSDVRVMLCLRCEGQLLPEETRCILPASLSQTPVTISILPGVVIATIAQQWQQSLRLSELPFTTLTPSNETFRCCRLFCTHNSNEKVFCLLVEVNGPASSHHKHVRIQKRSSSRQGHWSVVLFVQLWNAFWWHFCANQFSRFSCFRFFSVIGPKHLPKEQY